MKLDLLQQVHDLKIRNQDNLNQVWDVIRKKWVAFTPEEMVRQLFIKYIVELNGISIGRIAVEKTIKVSGRIKRFDILIYDAYQQPEMIIECKAPEIMLNDEVISQVVRYNQALKAPRLGIVNGIEYIIFEKDHNNHWQNMEHKKDMI